MTPLSNTIAAIASRCTVNAGGSAAACDRIREALGHGLPGELEEFYSNWQSITGEYGVAIMWPPDRVIEQNLFFRSNERFRGLYMPFDACLFFADAGNGNQFFVPVYGDGSTKGRVYVWKHELDERVWVAEHVHQFIGGCITGIIAL